jgi:hypothetical protein
MQSKYLKALPYILAVLVISFLYTTYLEEYSKDRIQIKKRIFTNSHISNYLGQITTLQYRSYLWRGNDDQMLKYYAVGEKKNAYLFIYYKNVNTSELIKIKTIEIQLLPENKIVKIDRN